MYRNLELCCHLAVSPTALLPAAAQAQASWMSLQLSQELAMRTSVLFPAADPALGS